VPAAAVIPAPMVSMMNVAVKKSVVATGCVYFGRRSVQGVFGMYGWLDAKDEGHWIVGREVKCEDPDWTDRSEGGALGLVC